MRLAESQAQIFEFRVQRQADQRQKECIAEFERLNSHVAKGSPEEEEASVPFDGVAVDSRSLGPPGTGRFRVID